MHKQEGRAAAAARFDFCARSHQTDDCGARESLIRISHVFSLSRSLHTACTFTQRDVCEISSVPYVPQPIEK
jgi:hypothetical protein